MIMRVSFSSHTCVPTKRNQRWKSFHSFFLLSFDCIELIATYIMSNIACLSMHIYVCVHALTHVAYSCMYRCILFYCFKLDYMYTKYIYAFFCRSCTHSVCVPRAVFSCCEKICIISIEFFHLYYNEREKNERILFCICVFRIWLWYKSFQSTYIIYSSISSSLPFFLRQNFDLRKLLFISSSKISHYWNSTKLHFWFEMKQKNRKKEDLWAKQVLLYFIISISS